jgi:hypothetical protein
VSVLDYKPVVIEGGDQVGKADASQNLIAILQSKIPITVIAFPMYSMPLGASVRKMLKEGIEDLVKEKRIDSKEEFLARMALFALNRLEVMNCLLEDRYKERLLIFDRSPYSHALTLSYGWKGSGKIEGEEVGEHIDMGLELEHYLIDTVKLANCVLELFDDSEEWVGSRSNGDDLYEISEVQEACGLLYSICANRVGDGWCKLATKVNGEWRDRGDISNDILQFIYSRYPDLGKKRCENPDVEVLELIDAVRALYANCSVSRENMDALRESLEGNDKKTLYDNSIAVVDDMLESMDAIVWANDEIKNAFKEVLDKNLFCWDIMEKFLGEKYVKLLGESFE